MVVQGRGASDAEAMTSRSPHPHTGRRAAMPDVIVRPPVAALICAALLAMPACSSGQPTSPPQAKSSQSPVAGHGCPAGSKYPPAPSVQQVSDRLKVLVDTHVPLEQRVNSVQGAERDPQILDRLATVLTDAHYNVVIHNIDDYCNGQASANSLVTFKGESNEMQIPLTVADNQWKLNNSWACDLMANASISSTMCTPA
jgi:hypothetical protein